MYPSPNQWRPQSPMESLQERIARNVNAIRGRMAAAAERAHRNVNDVRLVGVTKTVGLEEVRALVAVGVTDLGESRPEVAQPKVGGLQHAARWHLIGNLQRRKAKLAVELFDTLDAIDRLELAETVQRRCEETGRRVDALIEVNVSGEASKHGFTPDSLPGALRAMQPYDAVRVRGLLTMAPWDAEPDFIRGVFRRLRELAEAHGLPERSMGMTDDFEIAIEEGATEIRIGRALFD